MGQQPSKTATSDWGGTTIQLGMSGPQQRGAPSLSSGLPSKDGPSDNSCVGKTPLGTISSERDSWPGRIAISFRLDQSSQHKSLGGCSHLRVEAGFTTTPTHASFSCSRCHLSSCGQGKVIPWKIQGRFLSFEFPESRLHLCKSYSLKSWWLGRVPEQMREALLKEDHLEVPCSGLSQLSIVAAVQ